MVGERMVKTMVGWLEKTAGMSREEDVLLLEEGLSAAPATKRLWKGPHVTSPILPSDNRQQLATSLQTTCILECNSWLFSVSK
jgi:hypothetical protein